MIQFFEQIFHPHQESSKVTKHVFGKKATIKTLYKGKGMKKIFYFVIAAIVGMIVMSKIKKFKLNVKEK